MIKHATLLTLTLLLGNLILSPTLSFSQKQKKKKEKLLYISKRGPGFDIYKNTPDGKNETQLTKLEGWEWQTQYIKRPGKAQHVILFNSQNKKDGFKQRAMDTKGQLIPFDTKELPAFDMSPNGKWVIYTRKIGKGNHIILIPYKRPQDSIQITQGAFYHGRMKWSPDSRQICFIANQSGSNEIYIYDLNSKKTTRITNNNVREKYCTWSADGQQIITSMQKEKANNDLFLINLRNRKITRLTNTPDIHESEIAWSPSGRYVAYHAKVNGKDDIFLLNLFTKKVTKITQGQGYHGEPCWILEKD